MVELRTENPTNGESLIVATRIVNTGLESGNVTVSLVDDSGVLLGRQNISLEGGKWEVIEWDIEAWTTGDIEIIVNLEDHAQSELLLIDDVAEFNSKQGELIGTLGLVLNPVNYCCWRFLLCLPTEVKTIRAIHQTSS